MAVLLAGKCSYSRLNRRLRHNQPKVRSTTHRRASTTTPAWSGSRDTISSSTPYSWLSHATRSPRYPWSAQILSSRGRCSSNRASSVRAPCCSDQSAGTTSAPSSRPCVSTRMNRLRPVRRFPPVEAALAADLGRLHTLAIEHGRRGLRGTAVPLSVGPTQRRVDTPPRAVPHPQIVVVADTRGLRELGGQQPPLAARPQQVQQRVHDFAQVQRAAPAGPGGAGQQRRDQGPLLVGQIRRVRLPLPRLGHSGAPPGEMVPAGLSQLPPF